VDFQVGRRNFNTSIRILRQCSLQDNDNPGRGSKILSQLWIHYQNSPTIRENQPNMQIRTRLGASILHDSLWIWRRECDEQKKSRRGTRQNCKLLNCWLTSYINIPPSSAEIAPTRLDDFAHVKLIAE